jgi:hypothetical protein
MGFTRTVGFIDAVIAFDPLFVLLNDLLWALAHCGHQAMQ